MAQRRQEPRLGEPARAVERLVTMLHWTPGRRRSRPTRPPREELQELRRPHRASEEETLPELTAEIVQRPLLLGKLDPLGNHLELEAGAERDDRRRQRDVLAGADERAVHLEDVDGEPAQVAQ